MERISRRAFLKGAGAVAAVAVVPACDGAPPQQSDGERQAYTFLNAQEAAFIEAAVARLIPADELGPGALEAGVPFYIDRQLAGAWGAGAGLYRSGPWQRGVPEQGYQLPYTPAELFRNALRALNQDVAKTNGASFAALTPRAQDKYLEGLESEDNARDLGGVPSHVFFQSLLELTIEGFFADPAYGGNRNMVGWQLVGFPGAYANYYEFVDQHNVAFNRPPMSLSQDASGKVHLHAVAAPPHEPKRR